MVTRRKNSARIKREVEHDAPSIEYITLDKMIKEQLKIYGTYVLEDRAIPALQDGLKPSQRRLLWTLHHSFGSTPKKNYLKCARVTGGNMQFHPHGSSYPTLVNMVEGTPCPLISGYGNFGSYSKYAVASAERYSECRLPWFTLSMLFDSRFEKTYPTIPNYDGSAIEPVYLTAQLPLVLALGSMGIAMATTTNIPSFTIESLYIAVTEALKVKGYRLSAKRLVDILEFSSPYGGVMESDGDEVLALIETGTGSITWSCEFEVVGKEMFITGLAPNWNFDAKLEKIRELPYVSECSDIGEGNNIRVRIMFKRVNAEVLAEEMAKVEKMLVSKVHYRINVTERYVVEDPLVATSGSDFSSMSIIDIISKWTAQRVVWEKSALKHEHDELRKSIALQKLFKLAHDELATIFKLLKRRLPNRVEALAEALDITEEDSKIIWAMSLSKLDKLSGSETLKKLRTLIRRSKRVRYLFRHPAKSVKDHLVENQNVLLNVGKE